jgi:hypothetical protein
MVKEYIGASFSNDCDDGNDNCDRCIDDADGDS